MSDHWAKPFCCIPVAAAKDERLTKTALRVLMVLAYHANRVTGACTIKLDTLVAETGLAGCKVAAATALLVRLGWLRKIGKGGRSRPSTYHLRAPETLTESVMVTEVVTVTESITVTRAVQETPETLTESAPKTLTEAVKGKEQSNYPERKEEKEESATLKISVVAPSVSTEPAVLELDLVQRDGRYAITQAQLDRWQADYPDLNVLGELRKMRAWCEAKTRNRKTRRGIAAFIVGWLNRAQDHASRPPPFLAQPRYETAEERRKRELREWAQRQALLPEEPRHATG